MSMIELDEAQLKAIRLDLASDAPLYSQVRAALQSLIEERFQPGDAFFTEKTLVRNLPVSEITIRRALDDLRREGLLIRKRGLGTVVAPGAAGGRRASSPEFAPPRGVALTRAATLHRTVGIFRGDCYSENMNAMIEQISAVCAEHDINVQVYHTRNGERVAQAFRLVTRTPDQEAIILYTGASATEILYHAFNGRGYRVIAMEGAIADHPGAFVRTDAPGAVEVAMQYLIGLGHRRITFLVNEPVREPTVAEKIAKFHEILRAENLHGFGRMVVCDTRPCNGAYEAGYVHMEDVWPAEPAQRPTAIFTASDPGAWGCLKWFAERGIPVPREVSVLGFEDAHSSRVMHPALSSVAHPRAEIARRVVDLLWSEEVRESRHELISPFLVVRESTGPPPKPASALAAANVLD